MKDWTDLLCGAAFCVSKKRVPVCETCEYCKANKKKVKQIQTEKGDK